MAYDYCRERTKGRIVYVLLGLFFLFCGVSMLVWFYMSVTGAGKSEDLEGYLRSGVGLLGGNGLLAAGELFAMVNRDIMEHGLWVDRVCIGNDWVMEDALLNALRLRAPYACYGYEKQYREFLAKDDREWDEMNRNAGRMIQKMQYEAMVAKQNRNNAGREFIPPKVNSIRRRV